MPARKGSDYIYRLKNHPPETWIGGEKVLDPTTHPLVAPAVRATSRLYDIQWEEDKRDYMLFQDPDSKEWVGTQFLIPRSKDDLMTRRSMHKEWADASFGLMGRSSDFMTAMLSAWYVSADYFGEYAENVKNYFKFVRDNDLFLTHVLINPQVDRSQPPSKQPDEFTYLGVVKETDQGIIVRGAKMLATAGPYTDEVLVWPFTNQKVTEEDLKYSISFAVPMSTPGLRLIAREPYTRASKFDHPLASQFDELDGVLVFDDVLVPWERVFIYKDMNRVNNVQSITSAFTGHQSSVRLLSKMQFVAGIAMRATELINVNQFLHVQDMIGEITTYIELCSAAIISAEVTAAPNAQGLYIPNMKPLSAIRNSGNRWYPRIREIIQLILAGGLMYQPASVDVFNSPIKGDIEKYFRGADVSAQEKIKIFKLAADIAVSDFGSRHELYERFYAGDPLFLRSGTQYKNYNKEECLSLVKRLTDSYGI